MPGVRRRVLWFVVVTLVLSTVIGAALGAVATGGSRPIPSWRSGLSTVGIAVGTALVIVNVVRARRAAAPRILTGLSRDRRRAALRRIRGGVTGADPSVMGEVAGEGAAQTRAVAADIIARRNTPVMAGLLLTILAQWLIATGAVIDVLLGAASVAVVLAVAALSRDVRLARRYLAEHP